MRTQIPAECLLVGESGIHTRDDVLRLEQGGVDAILVGERLMASPDIPAAVRCLLGTDDAT
jgi:indole-3-glycerol phosphate synthase